jgi:chromate transporter
MIPPQARPDVPRSDNESSAGRTRLRELALYFLRLGTLGFGGPIALVGHMQKGLVEDRQWFSQQDYLQGLAFCQLSPGPLAAQLAIYLGWLQAGVLGGTLVGIAFILPSFLMVVALAELYVRFGSLPWIQGAFYGIGASVIAIIARSAVKLLRVTVGRDWLLWVVFSAMAITTAWKQSEIIWLFLLCGVVVMLLKAPPKAAVRNPIPLLLPGLSRLVTGVHGVAAIGTIGTLFVFFVKAGAFVFGSGLAIVPFLYGGVVRDFHWLTAVFAPPYFFVLIGAPYYRRFANVPQVKAFVQGVSAAAVGAIAGAAYILARRSLIDLPTIVIAIVTYAILSRTKKVPEPILIVAAGIVGVFLHGGLR